MLLALALAACNSAAGPTQDLSINGARDGSVFEECSTICLRPSDCAIAYPDGTTCPAGFRCALTFQCGHD